MIKKIYFQYNSNSQLMDQNGEHEFAYRKKGVFVTENNERVKLFFNIQGNDIQAIDFDMDRDKIILKNGFTIAAGNEIFDKKGNSIDENQESNENDNENGDLMSASKNIVSNLVSSLSFLNKGKGKKKSKKEDADEEEGYYELESGEDEESDESDESDVEEAEEETEESEEVTTDEETEDDVIYDKLVDSVNNMLNSTYDTIDSYNETNGELERELKEQEDNYKTLKQEADDKNDEIDKLKKELDAKSEEIEKLKTGADETKSLQIAIDNLKEKQILNEKETASYKETIKKYDGELKETKEKIVILSSENNLLRNTNTGNSLLDAAVKEKSDSEIKALKEKNEIYRNSYKELADKYNKLLKVTKERFLKA
ncbi:hypothetical protein [Lactococcus lactis]|uniref:hypothetical protein n=1 Tax=Lactococcus lactis TaxID=1358 RepID=UPI002891F05C|nr:hypothetical protein [Lactococcus lactis]MDT2914525.1 hypothetical protein [Lactococcus lactis]MDT2938661.1 hypothetical protein [Lactococcus lactis]